MGAHCGEYRSQNARPEQTVLALPWKKCVLKHPFLSKTRCIHTTNDNSRLQRCSGGQRGKPLERIDSRGNNKTPLQTAVIYAGPLVHGERKG